MMSANETLDDKLFKIEAKKLLTLMRNNGLHGLSIRELIQRDYSIVRFFDKRLLDSYDFMSEMIHVNALTYFFASDRLKSDWVLFKTAMLNYWIDKSDAELMKDVEKFNSIIQDIKKAI